MSTSGTKLSVWDDAKTKQEIPKRFRRAAMNRSYLEDRWIDNERSIYSLGSGYRATYIESSLESVIGVGSKGGAAATPPKANMAYAFKNFRFLHAQMSANPPSVVMHPTSSDQESHRKADAADRVVRWAIRRYSMQEKMDQMSLHTLLYGTGMMKIVWDSSKGAILEEDEKTGDLILEGDIDISIPFIWNLYLDPDAKAIDEIKFIFEKLYIDYEEACIRWPDKIDILKKVRIEERDGDTYSSSVASDKESQLQNRHFNCVELLEYWETGLAANGYLGRYCITTLDGDVVESCRANPHRFTEAGAVCKVENSDLPDDIKEAKIAKLPQRARLPYHILTDIDVPNMVWGGSMVEYAAHLQENLNRIDSAYLDNIRAHGVARMIVPDSSEIADDGMSDSPWDVTKITGTQAPFFMQPPQLMPDMTSVRVNHVQGINDIMGVNESMFGQQSREQAATAMQFATNQGNMIRRRLFNKYMLVTEGAYRTILDLIKKHWTTERTIQVLGKEKALEAIDLKGTDIDGGYDVQGEYGATFSLDPTTRKQEILTLEPLFEKAGVPARQSLRLLKLSEMEGMYDKLDLAGNRQKEIFDEMIASGRYIPPKKFRDHENMIAWALDYFMTSEFELLPDDVQALCEQHIQDRATLAAQEKTGQVAQEQPGNPPGPVPSQPNGPIPGPGTGGMPPIQTGGQ